jgi:hypothetical protein
VEPARYRRTQTSGAASRHEQSRGTLSEREARETGSTPPVFAGGLSARCTGGACKGACRHGSVMAAVHLSITASCKRIAKNASEQSIRVEHAPRPSPASRRFGIPSTRLEASATDSHKLPGSLLCLLNLAGQDREPHTVAITFDHLAGDSRQPQKAGSELHFDMHSRSGFRYRFAARCMEACIPLPIEGTVDMAVECRRTRVWCIGRSSKSGQTYVSVQTLQPRGAETGTHMHRCVIASLCTRRVVCDGGVVYRARA